MHKVLNINLRLFLCPNNLYKCGSPIKTHEKLIKWRISTLTSFSMKAHVYYIAHLWASSVRPAYFRSWSSTPLQEPGSYTQWILLEGQPYLVVVILYLKMYIHYSVEYKICRDLKTKPKTFNKVLAIGWF